MIIRIRNSNFFCHLRLDKKLTQAELGKIIGISASTIGMYEQNRRDPDTTTLSKIAEFFNVSADYLLDIAPDMTKNYYTTDKSNNINSNNNAEIYSEADMQNYFNSLDKVYLSYAKEAQENKIDPADIRLVLDTIKRLREQDK